MMKEKSCFTSRSWPIRRYCVVICPVRLRKNTLTPVRIVGDPWETQTGSLTTTNQKRLILPQPHRPYLWLSDSINRKSPIESLFICVLKRGFLKLNDK